MYATKEAIMAKEHARCSHRQRSCEYPGFHDGYARLLQGLLELLCAGHEQQYGIQYTRCRISALREDPQSA